MSCFVLLITDLTALRHEIAQHARGVQLITRAPHQLTREDWDQAALVLIDIQAAPILRARPRTLPHRDAVTLLADPEDADEPDLYRHALALGAEHLVTVPDGARELRKQISMFAVSPSLVVAVLDPEPSGAIGTDTMAGLAVAGTAAGHDLGLIGARPYRPGLHQALQRAERDGPLGHLGHVRELAAGDSGPPPRTAVQQAMTDLAEQHAVTLVNLDPHQPDTTAVLRGIDLVIVPVHASSVTTPATRGVVATAGRATPHVHVHVVGRVLDADVIDAVAAGIGAGYPSMTGVALAGEFRECTDVDAQLTDNHRLLSEVVTRYRPRFAQTAMALG